ncbi:MAG TPA: hypothetical protein VJ578_06835 [Dehalococcoidia bacterium]|nr:hypothetical protein [Dehalococcoidia bacterium]
MGNSTEEQEQAWQLFATDVGGELVTRRERGRRFLGRHLQLAVVAKAGTSPIALDLKMEAGSDVTPSWLVTRMRAPYVARDTFSFSVKRIRARLSDGAVLHGMARLAGRHKVEPGDLGFDSGFLITANDTDEIRALLADPRIRGLIQSQPCLDISAARPAWRLFKRSSQRLSVLRFEEEGVITDVQRLKSLFELFQETLNQLCQIGAASQEEPSSETLSAYRRDWRE